MAAGSGGNRSTLVPREARESCSSPSRPGLRHLLISFQTAQPTRKALPCQHCPWPSCLQPGRVLHPSPGGGFGVPGWRATPGVARG